MGEKTGDRRQEWGNSADLDQALGKERGVEVRWTAHRGKGSHGLLYYGWKMTTVRNLKDEVDKRAYHKMLKQLWLSEKEFE